MCWLACCFSVQKKNDSETRNIPCWNEPYYCRSTIRWSSSDHIASSGTRYAHEKSQSHQSKEKTTFVPPRLPTTVCIFCWLPPSPKLTMSKMGRRRQTKKFVPLYLLVLIYYLYSHYNVTIIIKTIVFRWPLLFRIKNFLSSTTLMKKGNPKEEFAILKYQSPVRSLLPTLMITNRK